MKFYVSHAVEYFGTHAIDAIGAYFSMDSLFYDNYDWDKVLPYQPQIENAKGNVIKDTVSWVLISGEFVAQGGERFITIGNFYTDANTTADTLGTPGYAYYYIDDVSVYDCNDTIKKTTDSTVQEAFLGQNFLNPVMSSTTIGYGLPDTVTAYSLAIYDLQGRLVGRYSLSAKRQRIELQLEYLAAGIYFYALEAEGRKRIVKRMLKMNG